MSEHNYAGLLFKTNLEKHPEVFIIDQAKLDASIKETIKRTQALDAKNAGVRNTAPEKRAEYNRLLNDHFNLKQWVRGCEVRVNESAGQIRNIEQRINAKIAEKNATESPIGQRNIEHAIVRLEGDLAEEKKKFETLRKENTNAVRQLKEFDVARLEALKAELETKPIVSK